MAIKKDEIEEEFKEAPEEMENEEMGEGSKLIEGKTISLVLPLRDFPEFKKLKEAETITFVVKKISNSVIHLETPKTKKEIERESEGSYRVRE